jgi:ketosteroid isomerase-like protein
MNNARIETQLLELERQYWQAMQDRDVEAAVRLTDFPCVVAGPSGIGQVDKDAFTGMMKKASYKIRKVELDPDAKVRLLSDDVAVVAYKVHEEVTVDGESLSLDCADTSTWVKRNGKWLCAHHTEAITGDSWGRDRRSMS